MSRRLTRLVLPGLGLVVAGVLVTVALPTAHGGFTAGVADSANSYGAGAVVLAATANGTTCRTSTSTISTNANSNCSGTLFPAALSGGSASVTSTITNLGNLSAGSVQLASGSTCGVLSTADVSTGATNAAVLAGGVGGTSNAPFSGSTALAFDGSSGYLQTMAYYNDPTTYSLAAWFYAPSGSGDGGDIIGFSNLQPDTSTSSADRMLYMNAGGHLLFGVASPDTDVIPTGTTYNDSTWHFVVAEESSAGTAIYVDGSLVASNSSYTSAGNYTGWWHIGWALAAGWPAQPTQQFFDGNLADVAVFPTALSQSAIATLYAAGSQSAEQADILADSPTSYWPLTSVGTAASGQVQTTGANTTSVNYCQKVDATIEDDTVGGSPVCLFPSGAGACPALSSSSLLSSLPGSTFLLSTVPGGSADKLVLSLQDQLTGLTGLDFSLPLTLSASQATFTGSLRYPASSGVQAFTG